MTALRPFTPNIHVASAPVSILGMRLTSTMTIVRLADDALLVHSPIALTPQLRAAVEQLGRVAHLFAPNLYHHLRLGEWSAAFPHARIHAPAGLARKRPDLRIDRAHDAGTPEPAFFGDLDEVHIDGFRLEETVLVERASGTAIVADLVHAVGRPTQPWARLYTTAMGFYDRVALSRVIRWTAFSDRKAARRSLDALLALPFDRVIVGHGQALDAGAREAIAAAYAWL